MRTALFIAILAGSTGACAREPAADHSPPPASDEKQIALSVRGLDESSGAAMSRTRPDVLFTINDSGNKPELFAVDTTGALRGRWRVDNAPNLDWEAIAAGPCGTGTAAGASCLYIGDVGDNTSRYKTRVIYRLAEPTVGDTAIDALTKSGDAPALVTHAIRFRYEDGPRDVEAMYVGPTGIVYLIGKRAQTNAIRQMMPARVYTLPPVVWDSTDVVIARLEQELPSIIPGSASFRTITDAALSPDSRYVAVRTYAEVYVFAADSATGRIIDGRAPSVCSLANSNAAFGEGITWFGLDRLLLTSEGVGSPMQVVRCPM